MSQSKRTFVDKLDFITSLGHGKGPGDREKYGVTTEGPTKVMTDLCVFEPDPKTKELTVVSLHPGVTREQVVEATGWPVQFAAGVEETPPPTELELKELRALHARTAAAHGEAA